MGLFRDKVNDPYNTMGEASAGKRDSRRHASEGTCITCPDCDGTGMRSYEYPARWAKCTRCGDTGSIRIRGSRDR